MPQRSKHYPKKHPRQAAHSSQSPARPSSLFQKPLPANLPFAQTSTIMLEWADPLQTSVSYFLVALFKQPYSHALPHSRHGSSPLSEASNAPHWSPYWSFQILIHYHSTHPQSPFPKYKLLHVRLCDQIYHDY